MEFAFESRIYLGGCQDACLEFPSLRSCLSWIRFLYTMNPALDSTMSV
jgi:hypothetical protein